MTENRNTLVAAAVIMVAFVAAAFLMPDIMLTVGGFSPVAAGVVAVVFVAAFFLVFWLRGRHQDRNR
ncbi:MAG: hypothetical protein JJ913_11730 [Rhizobiaceae bacterium]|nr:hypothetical protein [Rhizobiaceae bacterium]